MLRRNLARAEGTTVITYKKKSNVRDTRDKRRLGAILANTDTITILESHPQSPTFQTPRMTDRGSGNSQFGSVDCHDIHEHVALCPATYPPSKKNGKFDSKSIPFCANRSPTLSVHQESRKRRVVDRLLADSASCRLVAKYCHRCGHRHLSDQVNSYAAPEAPPPPTNHPEESVLNGDLRE